MISNLKMKFKNRNRESNLELLRIISILLIVCFHNVFHSGFTYDSFSYNVFIVRVFYHFGELGVNLFILISGYFLINSNFKLKKLLLLILEVIFYYYLTISIGLFFHIIPPPNGFKSTVLFFFPIILNKYWFITAYIITYIFSPYLNILAKNMKKNEYKRFLGICLIIWCVIPTFFGVFFDSSEKLLFFSRLLWMFIMYFVGAYIKMYGFKILDTNKKRILCAIGSFLIMILSFLIIYKFRVKFSRNGLVEIAYLWTPNNIFMFLLSISIFGLFLSLKIKNNKIINTIASTTLGVYLLHDGRLSNFIWKDLLHSSSYLSGHFPLLYIILSSVLVFSIGVIVDLIRQFIEKRTIDKYLDCFLKKRFR